MKVLCLALSLTLLLLSTALARAEQAVFADDKAAVILVYNRIGDDNNPAISLRKDQFEQQMQELAYGDYHVLPLADIVGAFQNSTALPPHSVVITFDGGHKSLLNQALPILEEHRLPFTVFISAGRADAKSQQFLSWNDLRKINKNPLATIGLHPASYSRIYTSPAEEIRSSINTALAKYRKELDRRPAFFAYPFGEISAGYRDIVMGYDFAAAFGQQSGVAYAGSDLLTLPRFPMTEGYGDMDRFRLIANALPLPLSDIEPEDPYLIANPPSIGFTMENPPENLSCFASGAGKASIEKLGQGRMELRFDSAFDQSRVRINCTAAQTDNDSDSPRWRWFGMLLVVPDRLLPSIN